MPRNGMPVAAEDPDLEEFRKACIADFESSKAALERWAGATLGAQGQVQAVLHGSVLDRKKFTADSDVDIKVLVNVPGRKRGPNQELTDCLRQQTFKFPFSWGFADWMVVVQ